MKKLLAATMLVTVSGCLFAQAPAENAPAQAPAVEAAPAAQPAAEPAPAPAAEAQAPAPAIKVEKIVTAAGIEKKEPVGETAAFYKDTEKVYTWTRIIAENAPVKVKHAYYLGDKKMGEIEIPVNGSPWRIWSAKKVVPGSWKVEILDEKDAVLASAAFTVSAEARPEPPAAPAAEQQQAPAAPAAEQAPAAAPAPAQPN